MPTEVRQSNPRALTVLYDRVKELDGKELQVGWFESTHEKNGALTAKVAMVHEYGAPAKNIPPRPFMRPTIAREQDAWRSILKDGATQIVKGENTIDNVYGILGAKVAGDIAKTIVSIHSPPLKEKTVQARARKRKDRTITDTLRKPLVDDAIMVNSVTWRVGSST